MKDIYASLNLPQQQVYVRDASMLRRFAAFAFDLLLLDFAVFTAFGEIFLRSFDMAKLFENGFVLAPAAMAAATVMALVALAYFALFEYVLGQTPGMMLLNLRAVNVTLWRAFVRNAYLIPLFPFPLFWVIEPLHLAFRKTRSLEALTGTRTIEYIG